jgi:uncharacterized protein with HEPN domain
MNDGNARSTEEHMDEEKDLLSLFIRILNLAQSIFEQIGALDTDDFVDKATVDRMKVMGDEIKTIFTEVHDLLMKVKVVPCHTFPDEMTQTAVRDITKVADAVLKVRNSGFSYAAVWELILATREVTVALRAACDTDYPIVISTARAH